MLTLALTLTCFLTSVTDGDTLRADCPRPERIRIANIDAPEAATCPRQAARATEYLRIMAPARFTVEVLYRDRYGRIVGIVRFLNGGNLGNLMLGTGSVQPWPHDRNGRALAPRPRGC
jgi:endonuclease YncB( thermonuclease family)